MSANFRTDLARGQVGEALFHKQFPHLTRLSGREADFIDENTGATYEIKTDSRSLAATPNFFMERWSDLEKQKPGGPWQALGKGITYFVYMFPVSNAIYIFDTATLVTALELLESPNKRNIANRTWTTQGWLVPRSEIIEIAKGLHYVIAD